MGMTTSLRWIVVALALVLAGWGTAAAQDDADPALIRRGEYIARAGDCIACHTRPGGSPMAGGLPLPTPLGVIFSTNITPSRSHGIGNYTYQQFADAMRRGIRADGGHLYPAMPYTSYALVTDEDMRALFAYFMHGVAAVDTSPPATELPFPFNIRLLMAGWNMLFLDARPFTPDPARSAEWNRGAYLTRGLAHCGTCHTPRNLLMAETTSREMGGGEIGPWQAPNITSDPNSGIGGWSTAELVTYMRDGHVAGKGQAAGPMAEAVEYSLRYLDTADLMAIATYIQSVPALRDPGDERPVFAWGQASDALSQIRGVALPADADRMSGAQLYDAYCASCHQAQGNGTPDGGLPSLFHNTTLGRSNTNNLVMVMLDGVRRHPDVFMPGFGSELSDLQVATLGEYLLQRFGNPAAQISADQVRMLRHGGGASLLLPFTRAAIAVAILFLAGAGLALVRRYRRQE